MLLSRDTISHLSLLFEKIFLSRWRMGTPLPAPSDFPKDFKKATRSTDDLIQAVNIDPVCWVDTLKDLCKQVSDLETEEWQLVSA